MSRISKIPFIFPKRDVHFVMQFSFKSHKILNFFGMSSASVNHSVVCAVMYIWSWGKFVGKTLIQNDELLFMYTVSATPQTDYYIVAGYVYQAPDLCTVINSRLVSTCS